MAELGRLAVHDFHRAQKIPVVLVLDNIRSMHNVGSIFRSSDAFLVNCIYLCGYTPQPPHRDIHKTALGATETVNWRHAENTASLLQKLADEGYQIVALEQTKQSIPLNEFAWDGNKIAVVLGNEVEGVQQEALDCCNASIEIPQYGTKHSLNVAVAAGIVLWHLAAAQIQ